LSFLERNHKEARRLAANFQKTLDEERYLAKECKERLLLGELRREETVLPKEMIHCCEKLLREVSPSLPLSFLQGFVVVVTRRESSSPEPGLLELCWDFIL